MSDVLPQDRNQFDGFEIELFQLAKRGSSPEQWAEWLRVPKEHTAAEGSADLFARLMSAGANGGAGWWGCDGRTLLGAAAHGSNKSVVQALLDAGAQPEVNVLFRYIHEDECCSVRTNSSRRRRCT